MSPKNPLHPDGWNNAPISPPLSSSIISRVWAAAAALAILGAAAPDIAQAAKNDNQAQSTVVKKTAQKNKKKKKTSNTSVYSAQVSSKATSSWIYSQVSTSPFKQNNTVINLGAALSGSVVPRTTQQIALSRQNEILVNRLETEKFEYVTLLKLVTDSAHRRLLSDAITSENPGALANKRLLTIMLYEPRLRANKSWTPDDLISPDALSDFEALIRAQGAPVAEWVYKKYFLGRDWVESQSAMMASSLREVPAAIARAKIYKGQMNPSQSAPGWLALPLVTPDSLDTFLAMTTKKEPADKRIPGKNIPVKPSVETITAKKVAVTPAPVVVTTSPDIAPIPKIERKALVVPITPIPTPQVLSAPKAETTIIAAPESNLKVEKKVSTIRASKNPIATSAQLPLDGMVSWEELVKPLKLSSSRAINLSENPQSFISLGAREILDFESLEWVNTHSSRKIALEKVMSLPNAKMNTTTRAKYTAGILALMNYEKDQSSTINTYLTILTSLNTNIRDLGELRGDIERTIIVLLISWESKNITLALNLRDRLETNASTVDGWITVDPNLGLPLSLLVDILTNVRESGKDQPIFRTNVTDPKARYTLAAEALKRYKPEPTRQIP